MANMTNTIQYRRWTINVKNENFKLDKNVDTLEYPPVGTLILHVREDDIRLVIDKHPKPTPKEGWVIQVTSVCQGHVTRLDEQSFDNKMKINDDL